MFLNCQPVCAGSLFRETPDVATEMSRNRARESFPKRVSANIPRNVPSAELCPNEDSALHDCESSTLCILARCYPLFRSIDDRPLSRDPLTDVRRAALEFCPVQFAERQESYGPSVHEKDVLKIDGHHASFLFEQAPEEIHILPANVSADVEDQKTRSDNSPIDSAGHNRVTFEVLFLAVLKPGLRSTGLCRTHI